MTVKDYEKLVQMLLTENDRLKEENAKLRNIEPEKYDTEKAIAQIRARNCVYFGFGEAHNGSEWARRLGLPRNTVWRYFQRGLTVEEIAEMRGLKYPK